MRHMPLKPFLAVLLLGLISSPLFADNTRLLRFPDIHGDTVTTRTRALDQATRDDEPSTDYITRRQITATFHVYDLEEVLRVRTMLLYADAESRSTDRGFIALTQARDHGESLACQWRYRRQGARKL